MNGEDDIGYQVELFVYDLSRGIAKNMSPALLGKEIEGIWHTGVVAYGREYFFGAGGIESCRPGGTILGDPDRVEELGESQVPYQLFLEYIFGLGEATYKPGAYDLFKHNCNNFSDEVSQFLCGRGIPKHILQLPDEVLNTPLGETLSSVVKDLDIKSTGSRKVNFGNYNNNNNLHTIVPGEYGRQRQQQQQQQQPQPQPRGDSPDLELERLNQAIDQVRQNTLRLEDRRNSINEKVNRHDKKKKERREKRERKEKKEKKKKKKSKSSCEVPEGVEGGGRHKPPTPPTSQATPTPSTSTTAPPNPTPVSPPVQKSKENSPQTSSIPLPPPPSRPPSEVTPPASSSLPEVIVTPVKEEEEGGGEGGGGGGGKEETESVVEEEERVSVSPQPITAQETSTEPITEQASSAEPVSNQETSPEPITEQESTPEPARVEETNSEPVGDGNNQSQTSADTMGDQEDPQHQPDDLGVDDGVANEVEQPRDSPPIPQEPEVEREPPITFKDNLDAREEFECLVGACASLLTPEEQAHLDELRAYVLDDEGSWALGENFSSLLGRVLHDGAIPDEARVHLVRVMAAAALKDDVILLLHQDRRDHTIMNYANRVESFGADQQEALALFFCNMFEHVSPSEWLLYISEWQDGNQATSNIRVTTKIAVNALLNTNPKCQEYGSAIMYNLGTKEVKTVVFDDVAPELAMAILQFFSSHPQEELLWRTMAALCRFTYSSTEVPALIKMIGPEPSTFRGVSERVDALVEEIDAKLSRVRAF